MLNIFKKAKTITVKMLVLDSEAKKSGKSLKGKVEMYLSQEIAKEMLKNKHLKIRKYKDPKNLNATVYEGSAKVK